MNRICFAVHVSVAYYNYNCDTSCYLAGILLHFSAIFRQAIDDVLPNLFLLESNKNSTSDITTADNRTSFSNTTTYLSQCKTRPKWNFHSSDLSRVRYFTAGQLIFTFWLSGPFEERPLNKTFSSFFVPHLMILIRGRT